jgi:hypothetical protein
LQTSDPLARFRDVPSVEELIGRTAAEYRGSHMREME